MGDADQFAIPVIGHTALVIAPHVFGRAGLLARGFLELLQQRLGGTLVQAVGHGKPAVAGILQKAGHVGAEPGLIGVVGGPQAKPARSLLHARQAAKGHIQPLGPLLAAQWLEPVGRGSGLVNEHQRVGAAGGLLQTAVGVHQQTLHGAFHVDGRLVGQREVGGGRAAPERIGHRRVGLEAGSGLQPHAPHFAHRRGGGLHLQRGLAHHLQLARRDADLDGGQAPGIGGLGAVVQDGALLVGQFHRRLRAAGDAQWRTGLHLHQHLLRAAREVGHIQGDGGAVAGGDEAGHVQLGHQRGRHQHLGIGAGIAVGRAGHRHQAQGAVEIRQVQRDGGLALGIEQHRAAEQIHQPHLARQALGVALARIATEPLLGGVAIHLFNELAVDVEQVCVIPVLAEKEVRRVGRGIAGDVQDAHIHRRQRDHRHAARFHRLPVGPGELHLDRHLLLGLGFGRGGDGQLELARLAGQRQVGQPQRTRRCDAVARTARTESHHGHIQVVPVPGRVNRDADGGAAGAHRHALLVQHAVTFHRHQGFAVVGRGDGQAGLVAAFVGRTFQLQAHAVGAVAHVVGILCAPARVKAVAGRLPGGRVQHLQPVAAIAHRQGELGARAHVQGAGLDQFFIGVVAAVPAALVVVAPVPLAFFAHQLHLQALGRHGLALRVDADQLERGQPAFGGHIPLEQRANAHQRLGGPPAAFHRAHHRPPARFQQAEGCPQLHGGAALRHVQRHIDTGLAAIVQLGFGQLLALSGAVIGKVAKNEAGPRLGQGQALALHRHRGQQPVACGGGSVQVVAGHLDVQRIAALQRGFRGLQFQLHALGQKLLHLKPPGRIGPFGGGVDAGFQQPAARGRIARQLDGVLVIGRAAGMRTHDLGGHLFAIGLFQGQRQRQGRATCRGGQGLAIGIAGQHGDREFFARAVQVAPGIHKQLLVARGVAAHVVFRQIQRRVAQRNHRHFLVAPRHHGPRLVGAAGQHRVAIAIGGGLGQALAVVVHQIDGHTAQGLPAFERGGKHIGLQGMAAHMQPDVGDVEVGHLVVKTKAAWRVHHGHVDAGLLQFLDFFHRQVAHIAPVGPGIGGKAAQVHAAGQRAQFVQHIARHRALEAAARVDVAILVVAFLALGCVGLAAVGGLVGAATHALQKRGQRGRIHTQKLHIHLGRVHRDHGQATVLSGGQHHAPAGKVERFGHGLALDRAVLRLAQRAATRSRQRLVQRNAVGAVGRDVGQVQHAGVVTQHPAARHRAGVAGRFALGHFHQLAPVLRAGQWLGEHHRHRRCAVQQPGLAVHPGKRFRTAHGHRLRRGITGFQLPASPDCRRHQQGGKGEPNG